MDLTIICTASIDLKPCTPTMTNEEIVLAEEANNFISRPRCIESLKIALCVYGFFCIMAFGITGGIWMLMGKRLDECRTPPCVTVTHFLILGGLFVGGFLCLFVQIYMGLLRGRTTSTPTFLDSSSSTSSWFAPTFHYQVEVALQSHYP